MELFIFLLLLLSLIVLSWFTGKDAPYVATDKNKIQKILKLAGVRKGKIFYELGSGDGRVTITAAKLGAASFGIELSQLKVWLSQYNADRLNLKNAQFIRGDVFKYNYSSADIVYCYLLRPATDKMEKKLKQELKKGAVVISLVFKFKSWTPFKKEKDFYFYRKS